MKRVSNSNQKGQKKGVVNSQNFLEALRHLGSGVVDTSVRDVAGGIAETAFDQLTGRKKSGELKPNEAVNLEQKVVRQEKSVRRFNREFFQPQKRERLVYTHAEQETKLQIAAIMDELKKLAQSTHYLAKEVEIAAKQVPVEPGVYHLNFFEKLRETILFLKKQIQESTTWLSLFNRRAKTRSYYWAQVKKSGTKFMLSQERYMATQAG